MNTEQRTIKSIERLNSSTNGNPRYRLEWVNGSQAMTSSDASCAYEVGNPGYREGDTVEVTFTRAGRIATMTAIDPRALTHDDRVAIYQLEKVDQSGDVQDMFEEQIYAVASGMDLEVDDDEASPGFMQLKLADDRWATLSFSATVFDSRGDLEARVFIATQYLTLPDCPIELEAEDAVVIGVFASEEAAQQATAEDAAERLAEFEADGEGIDQAIEYLDAEYRWAVTEQAVLS